MPKKYVRKTKPLPVIQVSEPDWPAILWALVGKGYRLTAIARLIDSSRTLLYGMLQDGSKPEYVQGCMILKLAEHEGICLTSQKQALKLHLQLS